MNIYKVETTIGGNKYLVIAKDVRDAKRKVARLTDDEVTNVFLLASGVVVMYADTWVVRDI